MPKTKPSRATLRLPGAPWCFRGGAVVSVRGGGSSEPTSPFKARPLFTALCDQGSLPPPRLFSSSHTSHPRPSLLLSLASSLSPSLSSSQLSPSLSPTLSSSRLSPSLPHALPLTSSSLSLILAPLFLSFSFPLSLSTSLGPLRVRAPLPGAPEALWCFCVWAGCSGVDLIVCTLSVRRGPSFPTSS